MFREAFRALLDTRTLLLDGGMGSLLIAEGLAAGRAPEWWVIERPEPIARAHRAYVEAGADVIHAVTFGANGAKLAAVGLAEREAEVNRRAVELAREAVGEETLVAGDLGPTGKFFPPMGDATVERLEETYLRQVGLLADAGVDLFSIETMYDVREATAAVRAARTTGLPVLASMTFERRRRGFFTLVGDRVGPSLKALHEAGADAVGINCSLDSEPMVELVHQAHAEAGDGADEQGDDRPRIIVDEHADAVFVGSETDHRSQEGDRQGDAPNPGDRRLVHPAPLLGVVDQAHAQSPVPDDRRQPDGDQATEEQRGDGGLHDCP